MADNPTKESALNQFEAENALVNLLDNSKAAGNKKQESEAPVDAKAETNAKADIKADDLQELTPDDLDLVSEETQDLSDEKLYNVKINGKINKVSLDELKAGYSKETDYRIKSSRLSDERKLLEEQRNKITDEMNVANQEREKYVQRLNELSSQFVEPKVDQAALDQLFNEDPAEYVRQQAEINRKRDSQAKLRTELQEEKRKNEEIYQQKMQGVLQREQELLVEKVPVFGDPVKGEKIRRDITSFLKNKGYKDQELNALSDHRTVIMAYDAMKMEQLRTAKLDGKKVKRVPKVASTSRSQNVDDGEVRPMDKALANQRKFSTRGNTQATKKAMKTYLESFNK